MPNYLNYRKSISDELIAVKDRVRDFINDANWGEDGRYKEIILVETLKTMLPDTMSIGTGFVIQYEKLSTQIDIIIYNNKYPVMFKKGDFVVVPNESVVGIIEVKSKLNKDLLSRALVKSKENGKIIGKNKFNGIFGYETDIEFECLSDQEILVHNLKECGDYVNNISCGTNIFIKYWNKGLPNNDRTNHLSIYKLKKLAMGYFISNLIEEVMKATNITFSRSTEYYESLYPILEGKEKCRIIDYPIKMRGANNEINF